MSISEGRERDRIKRGIVNGMEAKIESVGVDRFVRITKEFIQGMADELGIDFEMARTVWNDESRERTSFDRSMLLMGGRAGGQRHARMHVLISEDRKSYKLR